MMMKHKGCENEVRILEALGQGVATEAMEEPLRRHIASCASCAEVVSVYELFQNDREQLSAAAPLPNAGLVWWRATLAARRAAADRALRPILIVEKAALAIGGGVLLALLVIAAPWLAEHVRHSNAFTGNVVYSFPLSSFIVTSVVVCLLLMAGALYTVWAEKQCHLPFSISASTKLPYNAMRALRKPAPGARFDLDVPGGWLSVRICVLGSGSKGNSTLVATERTRLLVDAGFSKRDTFRRLAAAGERTDNFDALLVSHEHIDHINGLKALALGLKVPIYITSRTRAVIQWDPRLKAFETISPGKKFTIGDFEIAPFSIPHDAVDPIAFTLTAEGIKVGVITDLGYVPELAKQHALGCHCLVLESNHDLDMLKTGPYPWFVKQRVMSRHGHLSNNATAGFLTDDYDGAAQVMVLAHLSDKNNNPGLVMHSATRAFEKRGKDRPAELHLASQSEPTKVFQF